MAFDGANFLVVWQDFRSGKHYGIYAARVTPAGKVLDAEGLPLDVEDAANRVAPDAPRFAEPRCSVLAGTARADQAVANSALVAGPGGDMLLFWEHDESAERQVITGRMLSR